MRPAVRPLPPPLSEPSACHHALCPCAVRSDYTPRAIPWRQPAHAQPLSLRSPGLRPAGLSPEPGIWKLHSWLSVRQGASPFIHRAELRFKNGKRGPTGPGQRESIAEGAECGLEQAHLSQTSQPEFQKELERDERVQQVSEAGNILGLD